MDKFPLLEVRGLRTYFQTETGVHHAVDGVSFSLHANRTLGIVGESGCGKSVTSLSIMRLLAEPPAIRAGGEILYRGEDLARKSRRGMEELRGSRLSMIFQEPMTSLNPVYRVGDQIAEGLIRHKGLSKAAARERAIEMLRLVRIPSPGTRVDAFPHEMSGGMRQRVMIAMALACEPDLLIADEPTTALDVTIQAQILDLMRDLRQRTGAAIILITHDLGVIAEMADEVAVMYAGRIVEMADVTALFADAQHPYTLGLMASIPRLDEDRSRLSTIEGMVPSPDAMPAGCRFAPRCPLADARCRAEEPPLRELSAGHIAACWKAPIEGARP
ncbi:MAG: ABC transporter ATP-binding protein [Methylocystis sp.]|nr:ABC transporter ATP-binding protein [Methylocystis sp.]MCA3585008.1 ABC transporter ATP-binding protein [Methylocystis sp.]MCA3586938.1 ABC transporter ATP-binding protein [Methylocystis sp.]MCA3592226.1 ABC transporter ATP-binding protein [Methylocystis sp.]